MIAYFPKRHPAKGFSVKSIASKVKERLLNDPYRNQSPTVAIRRSIPLDTNLISGMHWANRSFEEYRRAA